LVVCGQCARHDSASSQRAHRSTHTCTTRTRHTLTNHKALRGRAHAAWLQIVQAYATVAENQPTHACAHPHSSSWVLSHNVTHLQFVAHPNRALQMPTCLSPRVVAAQHSQPSLFVQADLKSVSACAFFFQSVSGWDIWLQWCALVDCSAVRLQNKCCCREADTCHTLARRTRQDALAQMAWQTDGALQS